MKNTKILAAAAACLIAFSGCSSNTVQNTTSTAAETSAQTGVQTAAQTEEKTSAQTEKVQEEKAPVVSALACESMRSYSANVTVDDLKKDLSYDGSRVKPIYNVSETEVFTFNFGFSAYDAGIDLYDYVSIHTDAQCLPESSIYYTAGIEVEDGKTTLTAAPMTPVLGNLTQRSDYAFNETDSWGNAPIYYIALHYSLDTDTPEKLEQPVIIPFTVKHEVNAPTLRSVVSSDGRFTLEWDAVEGAEKYNVYNLVTDGIKTGENNHAIDGAKMGYDCGKNTASENELYLLLSNSTEECTYDGFAGMEGHSLSVVTSDLTGQTGCYGQNYSVCGEYYVTAVVDGKESGLSNAVSSAGLSLPYTVSEETEIQSSYYSADDFPSTVEVINIDGTRTMRNVHYERTHVTFYEYEWDEYNYTIEGTHLYGHVAFEEDGGEPKDGNIQSAETGNTAPEDNVDRTPDIDIVPEAAADENETLVAAQMSYTEKETESAAAKEVAVSSEGVYINADSAEEAWIALNLVNGSREISLEAFPLLQDPYQLVDVFYKTYYQNPYVMSVLGFSYDYASTTLSVEYAFTQEEISERQEAVSKEAAAIIASEIKSEMTEREKAAAIYSYLEKSSVYDKEALADAEEKGFKKSENNPFEDSFNTYGILVNKKGVCMSYAYSFKLLCDLCGVRSIVVTGYINGNLPHAWNMVSIDGKWYEIDCTNNEVNSGIPYFLFEADSSLAAEAGYVKDDLFADNSNISSFVGTDESLEYYRSNGLLAGSMSEYKDILTANLDSSAKLFAVRWTGDYNQDEFANAVILAFNELGIENKLQTLKYAVSGGFIVLMLE